MSIVATAASAHGITVIADRRFTRSAPTKENPRNREYREGKKLFYSPNANIAFVVWGTIFVERNGLIEPTLDSLIDKFSNDLTSNDDIQAVVRAVKSLLDENYADYENEKTLDRRGVHVSGFDGERPVIYHVHSGDPLTGQKPRFAISNDSKRFARKIKRGHCAITVNGINDKWLKPSSPGLLPDFHCSAQTLEEQAIAVGQYLSLIASVLKITKGSHVTDLVSRSLDCLGFTKNGVCDAVPSRLALEVSGDPSLDPLSYSGNLGVTLTTSILPISTFIGTTTSAVSIMEANPKTTLADIFRDRKIKDKR